MDADNELKLKLALFDIDDTILTCDSTLSFLRFFLNEYYGTIAGTKKLDYLLHHITNNPEDYSTKELINQYYYMNFKGINATILRSIGKKWFEKSVLENSGAFNEKVLERLKNHQREQYRIVLVSGGFFAPLDPLIAYLSIEHYFYVTPHIRDGLLTGELKGIHTVGLGKFIAIMKHFHNKNVDWQESYAYGAHFSDVPVLNRVGHSVIVGADQQLLQIANDKKWEII
ncbi:MAG: HAD-IB family hydrolase [Legionella sp.]|nr:HAD-IB family hydrolase [Legionella sp.]